MPSLSQFHGPVFVVGMPRSGTKLLRDLLNRHPRIGIPTCESHFIPTMIRRFGEQSPFRTASDLGPFLNELRRSAFIQCLSRMDMKFDASAYIERVDASSWESLFATLLRMTASRDGKEPEIYGDKTPGYLVHMRLLARLFPAARFLHIIRDPRDYALSVRRTWGKSLMRAAQRWGECVRTARGDGAALGARYREVLYEDLLGETERVIRAVCIHLGVEFEESMCSLAAPSERYGEGRERTDVVRGNAGKFRQSLTTREIRRIEEIVWPVLEMLPYRPLEAHGHRPLSRAEGGLLKLYDGAKLIGFYGLQRGVVRGMKHLLAMRRFRTWSSRS